MSSLWTLVPWLVPEYLYRFLPELVRENVECAVYDGMTRWEWAQAQVDEINAARRRRPGR